MTEILAELHPADTCVHCGLCLPHCPTFRLTGNEAYSPRGRLAAISAVDRGVATIDAAFDEALSTCLGCRACEAVCPGMVPYGRVYEEARADLAEHRTTFGRRFRRLLLGRAITARPLVGTTTWVARIAQRLRAAAVLPGTARRGLAGLRPLERGRTSWVGRSAGPSEETRGTIALLSGCVMDAWFGPVHDATVGVLTRAGYRVVVPAEQSCCGALAAHDGHATAAQRLAQQNLSAFADTDLIVSDAAGCTAHLKDYGHWAAGGDEMGARVRDVTELVATLIEDGVLPTFPGEGPPVAVQDPCHLRHAQRIVAAPRTIVRAAGHRPVEIDPDGLCCGAAGIYSVLHPETSTELGRRKAGQVEATGTTIVASANPGCEMQLRTHLGPDVRVAHPVELYWEALSAAP